MLWALLPLTAGAVTRLPPVWRNDAPPAQRRRDRIDLVTFLDEQGPKFFSADPAVGPPIRPPVLRPPTRGPLNMPPFAPGEGDEIFLATTYPPLGFAGSSSIPPSEVQTDSHFVPVEDRWRIGFQPWDRYNKNYPPGGDFQYVEGNWWDPYNQNVIKGDYPIIGQQTFLNVTAKSTWLFDLRQVPTATTPFESTIRSHQEEFFGRPNQFLYFQPMAVSFDLFHGDAGFKQPDWRVKLTGVFNVNMFDVEELAVVNPDVRRGTQRERNDWALEEWFFEVKLADLSPDYDTLSVRAGSQFFLSDFRGFIFNDVNRAVRIFGTRHANRDQFNLIWFDQTEKETNSGLNTFGDRHQNTLIANYYRQDFIWPGYTTQLSFHYNRDQASTKFDANDVLVRPDPVGVFAPHEVNSYYIGWAGDGHINRFNISHAFYWALGDDQLNPLSGKPETINAQFLAIELSYDRDWVRFRSSFLWSSGDNDLTDQNAEGFDAIFDRPNFAGGEFSFWQRQAIRLFGINLVNAGSIVPNMRSSRIEGQTNFVNPGLFLLNVGADADITPKLKLIGNVNFLWFHHTLPLEVFTFQDNIRRSIGTDLSLGTEYRPFLNDNLIIVSGIAGLIPGNGFHDLYRPLRGDAPGLFAGFVEFIAEY